MSTSERAPGPIGQPRTSIAPNYSVATSTKAGLATTDRLMAGLVTQEPYQSFQTRLLDMDN
jgi:hypothetical protein